MPAFIFCATCQRYRALPDGHKTPSGKAVCNACYDKFAASQKGPHKAAVKSASKLLKNKPDVYAIGILKSRRSYD